MAFSRTWNAAYEAQPADVENISLGAGRIRDLKSDIQERGEIDHSWAGNADDGKHKQVTLLAPLGADPANIADHGFVYMKDVSAKVELFWEDEDGNIVQMTAAGALLGGVPAGTKMLFVQTAAPAGWTKDTDQDDKALRIVSGAAGTGGATAFTTVFGSGKTAGNKTSTGTVGGTGLSVAQLPAHAFTVSVATTGGSGTARAVGSAGAEDTTFNTNTQGSGSTHAHSLTMNAHNHTLSLDLNYVDVIKATKD